MRYISEEKLVQSEFTYLHEFCAIIFGSKHVIGHK